MVSRILAGGRYELRRFLGEGGRKRVYLAHDNRLSRDVAIALIKTEGLDETGYARARREAEAMGKLGDHPHIVTIHDIGEDAGQLYIVSQYMAGGDLAELMQDSPDRRLSPDRATDIAKQICEALEHAHAHGVVHRDLKPKNVWLTADGTAKLGDFGLAVALDHSRITLEGMLVGTVAYMPPEQGMGRSSDARSDLYSLGVLLYELVCGRPPFTGDDAVTVISQHINTAPVAPSWHVAEIPRSLEELILKLLAKSPDERPKSAAVVRQSLEIMSTSDFVAPEPIVHDRANPLDRMATGIFVGRERETEELRSSLEAILSGRGRVLLVAGEMGIGKTRLAAELATYASLRGAQVLWGRCYEGEGAPPYWPWVQVIRSYVGGREAQVLSQELGPGAVDIAQMVPEVREHLPGLPAPVALDPEQARFRLFDAVSTFLKNASASQPLLVILDDLQWADRASLLLLQFVAGELAGSRVLVVGTYRDVEVGDDHALSDVLASLRRERDHKRVLLKGFSVDEVTQLLETVAEHKLGDREKRMIQLMHAQTEGNPFFIEEVVRHLVETNQLRRQDGKWMVTADSVEDLGIPEGVRETISRRISRLSDECNNALSVAAVIGREFGVDQLEQVTDQSRASILAVLDEALEARIIVEAAGAVGKYRFAHGLTRETLYEKMSTTRRVSYHAQITEAIEARHAESIEQHLPELAYHANEAILVSGADKAIDYLIRAARRAMQMLAYEDAVSYYEKALDAVEAVGSTESPAQLCELQVALGDARWRSGEFDKAREAFRQGAETAARIGAAEMQAAAALGYGGRVGFATGLDDKVLMKMLEDALSALGDEQQEHLALRARLTGRLAEAVMLSETLERRTALSDEGIALARQAGDPVVLGYVLGNVHLALDDASNLERRMSIADEMLEIARQAGDERLALEGYLWRLVDLLESGKIDEAEREFTAWSALAEKLREPYHLWWVGIYRTMRALLDGRLEEAEELAATAYGTGQGVENSNAVQLFGGQYGFVRREQGRAAELGEGAKAFAEQFPMVSVWKCYVLRLDAETGQRDQALEALKRHAATGFADVHRDFCWSTSLVILAEACELVEDAESAELLYDLLRPYTGSWVVAALMCVCYGPLTGTLGVLATILGRYDEAEGHYRSALEEIESRDGMRLLRAHTQSRFAKMLLRRDEEGDRSLARKLINDALETARECSMRHLTEELLALKIADQGLLSTDIQHSIYAVAASVDAARPDLRPHAAPDGTVTIMFSDIEGSTEHNERLGDQRWMDVLHHHNDVVRQAIWANGGYEVKSQGDGFMVAFSSARKALMCALQIQGELSRLSDLEPERAVRVRIGLHTGEVIKDQDDFFGKNVVLAARIGAQAKGGEILVSGLLKALVESSGDWAFTDDREVELKGLSGTHRVCTLNGGPVASVG